MLLRMVALAGVLIVAGFQIVLSLPLLRRAVAPNDRYGLRTPATRSHPDVWYEANARSAREGIASASLLSLAAAALAAWPRLSPVAYATTVFALTMLTLVGGALWGAHMARRLAAARGLPPDGPSEAAPGAAP